MTSKDVDGELAGWLELLYEQGKTDGMGNTDRKDSSIASALQRFHEHTRRSNLEARDAKLAIATELLTEYIEKADPKKGLKADSDAYITGFARWLMNETLKSKEVE